MRRSKEYLRRVCKEFFNVDNIVELKELTGGHINETYVVVFKNCRYILQLINNYVFYSPQGVMNNARLIIDHITKKVIYNGEDPNRAVLNIVQTRYGQDLAIVDDEYWRCMRFIEGGRGYNYVESPEQFYQIGRAVGNFQDLLSDFHTRMLDDTIRHFHDTPYRFNNFKKTVKLDEFDRVKDCKDAIKYIADRENIMSLITSKLADQSIPRRVTHNDTKSSNVMLDAITGEYLCLIDLDTVMKGSLLYDYGDALRFGASTALEDETDLEKVGVDLDLFRAFTEGFLLEMKPTGEPDNPKPISKEEIAMLYDGFRIITLELAMRFLDDYLSGDKYFRIDPSRPKHNLERAKNQLKLVYDIENKEKQIKTIINEILVKLDYDRENLIDIK